MKGHTHIHAKIHSNYCQNYDKCSHVFTPEGTYREKFSSNILPTENI